MLHIYALNGFVPRVGIFPVISFYVLCYIYALTAFLFNRIASIEIKHRICNVCDIGRENINKGRGIMLKWAKSKFLCCN